VILAAPGARASDGIDVQNSQEFMKRAAARHSQSLAAADHDSQAVALPRHATWIDQARRRAVRVWQN